MATARVFQINTSSGGVPKSPVHRAAITAEGVAGDGQHDLRNHGGPDRAVCLFSLDRILELQEEGHPIFPGSAGENLTLVGLPWEEMAPGVQLRLGAEVCVEITSFTSPCGKIKDSFVDGDFNRVSQERHPGWSRVYGRVVTPGSLKIGDRASLGAAGEGETS